MADWQVQEAKMRFSEIIERAQTEGPQTITRHGKPRAVLVSVDEFSRLKGKRKGVRDRDFVDFLLGDGPSLEGLDLERSKDTGRDMDLE